MKEGKVFFSPTTENLAKVTKAAGVFSWPNLPFLNFQGPARASPILRGSSKNVPKVGESLCAEIAFRSQKQEELPVLLPQN